MKRYIILWSIAFLLLSIGGCKKEIDNPNRYIDDYYRNYFFKTGTYWVYENNITHELDSQYVKSHDYYLSKIVGLKSQGDTLYSEQYIYYTDQFINDSVYMGNTIIIESEIALFGWGFQNNNKSTIGITRSAESYNNIVVASVMYNNVAKWINSNNAYSGYQNYFYKTEFWLCPNIGFIKRIEYDTPNGTVEWNLVRYHINI